MVSEFYELERLIIKVEYESSRHYFKALNLENLGALVSHERKEHLNRKAVFEQIGLALETFAVLEGTQQAYVLDALAWELILVSRGWHGQEDGFDLAKLEGTMRRLEVELELPLLFRSYNCLQGR